MRIYQRGKKGTYWVDFATGGVRVCRSTGHTNKDRARKVGEAMFAEVLAHNDQARLRSLNPGAPSADWLLYLETDEAVKRFDLMFKNAKGRDKASGRLCGLDYNGFWNVVKTSGGKCAVTGLPFARGDAKGDAFQPSLDRIDSSIGYSAGNCRLVLLAVNYAMNTWGHETFRRIAFSYAAEFLSPA